MRRAFCTSEPFILGNSSFISAVPNIESVTILELNCFKSISVSTDVPFSMNVPSRLVPDGITIPPAKGARKSMLSLFAFRVIFPFLVLSLIALLILPFINKSKEFGMRAWNEVMFRLFMFPSTPAIIFKGIDGYFFMNSLSAPPIILIISGLPISAIKRQDALPGL